jgi:hypothetical protein
MNNPNDGARTVLHEIIHFAFHDLTLASAVARLKEEPDEFKGLYDKSVSKNDVGKASNYWDNELKANCEIFLPNTKVKKGRKK